MTWWGWSVGTVLVLYPLAVAAVLYLGAGPHRPGDLRIHQERMWVRQDGVWVLLPPPARADTGLRFHEMTEPSRPPRPVHSG